MPAEPGRDTGGRRRFTLQRTLGEGTFGTVYLADMEGAGGFRRRVALKVLNGSWDASSDAGQRLRDEARLLGRLQHRNIVRVDDLVQLRGQWALVMEYVSGSDLETLFAAARERGLPLPARPVLDLGAEVAAALDAAWSAEGPDGEPLHVIHRDIKPSNIRLSEMGDVKVLDFGVARAEFAGREARTERVRYGSLGYMAPERLLGEPESPGGDVFALGVVLYELLVLDTYGRSELAPEGQAAQVDRAIEKVGARLGEEAGPICDLLARMLSFNPAFRPTAAEVEMELRAIARATPGDELSRFARTVGPTFALPGATTTDPVQGKVMEESGAHPTVEAAGDLARAVTRADPLDTTVPTSSGTIVLPDDGPADPPDEAAPRPHNPLPWVAAALLVAALAVLGWRVYGPHHPDPVPPEEAQTAAAALAEPAAPSEPAPTASPELAAPATPGPAPATPEPAPATPEPAPAASAPATTGARAATRPPADGTAATGARPAGTTAAPPPAEPAAGSAPTSAGPPADTTTTSGGTRLRAAKFTLSGGQGVSVRCGDRSAAGATSALVTDFLAGPCVVSAGGATTTLSVESPRGVSCTLDGGALTCR